MKELSGMTLIFRNDTHSSQGIQGNTLFIPWRFMAFFEKSKKPEKGQENSLEPERKAMFTSVL